MAERDRLTLARLDGTALRHAREQSPEDAAVAELQEIATDHPKQGKPALRVDLLSRAAGHISARFDDDPSPVVIATGHRAAQLLVAAGGTDAEIGRAAAEAVRAHSQGPVRNT